ncbi:flagellin lysine-N-methylase [Butyrivibrio sp. NC3005]|uniref:flagellin lysine-N-methylase n=1 Tax=Butyrivibrio sp. NC3005 TaxID=1280685 RepID=UPI0004076B69|nr:flagellin lysine-N-methylase [Butyrivibrio sp. NC3005]
MRILKNELYDKFKCLAGNCPETCCYGWRVLVDDDTKSKYEKKKGFSGFLLKRNLGGPNKNFFNYDCGSCFFHNFRGLCSLQNKMGEEYMPLICRNFPREIRNYGYFATMNMDLSCIAVSKMLLENPSRPDTIVLNGECTKKRHGSNDDPQFAEIINKSLIELIELIKIPVDQMGDITIINCILSSIFHYCNSAQKIVLDRKDMMLLNDKNMPLSFFEKERNDNLEQIKCFPLPITCLNKLINTDFEFEDTRRFSNFKKVIDHYHHIFDSKTEEKGEIIWKNMIISLFRKDHYLSEVLLRYLHYDFQQCFSELYENYSFTHFSVNAILHLNMLALLMVIWADRKELRLDDCAYLISSYERGCCHNPALQKKMYKIVCDYLPL